jgi:hypothetical protein
MDRNDREFRPSFAINKKPLSGLFVYMGLSLSVRFNFHVDETIFIVSTPYPTTLLDDTNPEKLGLDFKRISQFLRHRQVPALTRNVKKNVSFDIKTEKF